MNLIATSVSGSPSFADVASRENELPSWFGDGGVLWAGSRWPSEVEQQVQSARPAVQWAGTAVLEAGRNTPHQLESIPGAPRRRQKLRNFSFICFSWP